MRKIVLCEAAGELFRRLKGIETYLPIVVCLFMALYPTTLVVCQPTNWGFESGLDDWTVSGGVWEVGQPSKGPMSGYASSSCLATKLVGSYPSSAFARAVSPTISVPTENSRLRFWHWIDNKAVDFGYVRVSSDDGATWNAVPGYDDYYEDQSNGWTRALVDLSAYGGSQIRVAFTFSTDGAGGPNGWFVDDVEIESGPYQAIVNSVCDFENGYGDWFVDNGIAWQIGAASASKGPAAAHNGSNCAGTQLIGSYQSGAFSRLISPQFVVPSDNPRLRFWHWFDNESNDYGRVEISVDGGVSWAGVPGYDALYAKESKGWTRGLVDLSRYKGETVNIAFRFSSDGAGGPNGWFVDEVSVETGPYQAIINTDCTFENGYGDWFVDNGTVWQIGTPSKPTGPPAGHNGSLNCAGTLLSESYMSGAYARLTSPPFVVPISNPGPTLTFSHWYDNEASDFGYVEISVDSGKHWAIISNMYSGSSSGWVDENLSLDAYEDQPVLIGFRFSADGAGGPNGWFVDDVAVNSASGIRSAFDEVIPEAFQLGQNYPNPFNPDTEIQFSLARPGQVSMDVFNISGQLVVRLVDEFLSAGDYVVDWEGHDEPGNQVASGVYFYRLKVGDFSKTNRMVLLR